MNTKRLAYTVPAFCEASGLGATKVWEMVGDGTLESVLAGGRRLILARSAHKLLHLDTDESAPASPTPMLNPAVPTPRRRGRPRKTRTAPTIPDEPAHKTRDHDSYKAETAASDNPNGPTNDADADTVRGRHSRRVREAT